MPTDFEKQSYWHERFASEQAFEWLVSSTRFIRKYEALLDRFDTSARVLHLGCGTSDLQNHFRHRGFLNVTNVDYEPLAITRGQELEHAEFGNVEMQYVVADATRLGSNPEAEGGGVQGLGKFDLVVDKSTADAISCAGEDAVLSMAAGVRACLAEGGVWISMSYSAWRFDIQGLPFRVELSAKVPTPKARSTDPDVFYYCYILRP